MKTQSILLGFAATALALHPQISHPNTEAPPTPARSAILLPPQTPPNAPQFDDLTNVVAGLVPAIQPLGAYGTLTYQGFI